MQKNANQWFSSWFDTPFYHTLYKNRDYKEAQLFIDRLLEKLLISKDKTILDLACGRGRHSVYLNSLGYTVKGVDLSQNSIRYAKTFENEKLTFERLDMRNPLTQKTDVILNLFTSFGYFDTHKENIDVLKNIKQGLHENGIAVIDFLNTVNAVNKLIPYEEKLIDSILFKIRKGVEGDFIVKKIDFDYEDQPYSFTEKVRILPLKKMLSYIESANFKLKYLFGNYQLDEFNEVDSDRFILVLQ